MKNLFDAYLAAGLPPRWETDAGTCTDADGLYLTELRGIMTGQPVVQLSQLFAQWNQNPYPGRAEGGSTSYELNLEETIGVCAEQLWPITLAYGPDTVTTGVSDYVATELALNTRPTSAAFADAENHVVLKVDSFIFDGTQADMIAKLRAEIDAGYGVSCSVLGQNHAIA